MKVKLNDVSLDKDIYPRQNESAKTIASYVEALKGGGRFPPIEVQKIIVDEYERKTEMLICLDGWHRLLAYREYNKQVTEGRISEIEATCWKDKPLDKDDHLEELRIRSARLNVRHGDRLAPGDLRFQLLRIVESRPLGRLKDIIVELAEVFGYSDSYISDLIGAEVRAKKASRDAKIFRLSLLGWSQKEIGELFGLTQPGAGKIITKFDSGISFIIRRQFLEEGKTIEELAEFYKLDDITLWAIILQDKNDLEGFSLFGKSEYQDDSPRLYNVWNFIKRDPRLGEQHPGNIPGQIAMNVLYYYTEPGALVVDPMAGGGSTVDACLVMGRRCRVYDIKPIRKEIVQRDLLSEGFAKGTKGCDLIFLDPPYWRLQRGFYTEESVSETPLDELDASQRKSLRFAPSK